jgi:hypothetical protein
MNVFFVGLLSCSVEVANTSYFGIINTPRIALHV